MRRARTWDEMVQLMAPMFQLEEQAYREFRPRPSDVIIAPSAKCGTTWLQQIVHSLRTGGDMDFSDIYEVVPWIDVAPVLGLDLSADQRAEPRAFKSHAAWDGVPKGCRYLVAFRDPKDVVVSLYRFFEGWFVEPGAIALDDFVARRMFDPDGGSTYWPHQSSWLAQRDNPNVMLLTFEAMKRDLPGAVRRIAGFLDLDLDAEQIDQRISIATRQSSFDFMSTHPEPFSEPLLRRWVSENVGIPLGNAAKVRVGAVGTNRKELSAATATRLDQAWRELIGSEFGYASYDELVADMG